MSAIRLGRSAGRTSGVLAASILALGLVAIPALGADPKPKPKLVKDKATAAADPAEARGGIKEKAAAIDALLQDAWEGASVKPSKRADDAEYLRRAYLDLVGRIPNVKEANDFLTNKDADKRLKLIETLLVHPDYAKNMASNWTILLVGRKNQERMVDKGALTAWLRVQFASNRPWNQVANDLITAKGSNKANGAANFAMSHLENGAVPLTSITTRVFLGQQIQCTQCHDHPSNDWKQQDFWSINAFFKGIRTREVTRTDPNTGLDVPDHTEVYDEPTDAFSTFDKRNAMVGIAFPTFLDGRKISQGTDVDRREALGKFITEDNEQFGKAFVNRIWCQMLGRGFVFPTDDFGAHNQPSNPELLDHLASEFKASGYDVRELIRRIAACQAYNATSQTTKENEKDDTLASHMGLKPLNPEQLFDSLIVATSAHKAGGGGDTDKTRGEWMRQFQFAFANDEGEESTSFQGTIPQALMMMNGPLMEKATSGQSGSFLADLLAQAQLQSAAEDRRLRRQPPVPRRPEPIPDPSRTGDGPRVPQHHAGADPGDGRYLLGPAELQRVRPEPLTQRRPADVSGPGCVTPGPPSRPRPALVRLGVTDRCSRT